MLLVYFGFDVPIQKPVSRRETDARTFCLACLCSQVNLIVTVTENLPPETLGFTELLNKNKLMIGCSHHG